MIKIILLFGIVLLYVKAVVEEKKIQQFEADDCR